MPVPTTSSVYVVAAGEFCKIGVSADMPQRLKQIESCCPLPVTVTYLHEVGGLMAFDVEAEAHRVLAKVRHRGEWFQVTPERAKEAVLEARAIVDANYGFRRRRAFPSRYQWSPGPPGGLQS